MTEKKKLNGRYKDTKIKYFVRPTNKNIYDILDSCGTNLEIETKIIEIKIIETIYTNFEKGKKILNSYPMLDLAI